MENFTKRNFFERMLMEQKKLEQYYRDLRKYELEINAPLKEREYYEKWYKFLKIFFTIEMYATFRPVKVHQDLRSSKSSQSIYAVTHVGRFDIESSIITRGSSAAFVWGDPGKLYKSPLKFLIDRLGVIFMDTDREYDDTQIGLQTMIKYAKHKINLNVNPEGAWCILDGKAVMPLFDGTVITAMESNVPITPVAIVFYGRKWYISYGKEMRVEPFSEVAKKLNIKKEDYEIDEKQYIKEQTANLRDAMATLKWELIREYSGKKKYVGNIDDDLLYTVKRSSLDDKSHDKFVHSIMKDTDNDYGVNEIEATRYKDKNHPEPQEIEKDLEQFIKEHPAFFLASNERFVNYINTCINIDNILNYLKYYREKQEETEKEPLEVRLEKYKALKKTKNL